MSEEESAKRQRVEEEEDKVVDSKEEEEEEDDGLDPHRRMVENMAKEFASTDDDFEVMIGPDPTAPTAAASSATTASSAVQDASGEGKPAPAAPAAKEQAVLPAFRFSGSSLTASLHLAITPEQEEAMKEMGVNSTNYAMKIRPPGGYTATQRRRSALEDDLEEIENQKWKDPGANQSDFFNFGLNEATWKEYAARQVALRLYRLQQLHEQRSRGSED